MPRKKDLQVVVHQFHPQVSLLRDFLGYVDDLPFIKESIDDTTYLKSLDPLEWRLTDHYRVLGLGDKRFRASEDEIRKAYRRRVLDHHPDKRSNKDKVIDASNDYFACITKAFEILGNPTKRFAYDCVDKIAVDDEIPSKGEIKENFYCLNDVFQRNARWSKRQPMPSLGSKSTHIDLVHKFYDTWDVYETIRDYSYEDEEEKDKGEDRDHRRYLDKLNKTERAKKRAAEMKRIQGLVIMARELDPRLKDEQERLRRVKEEKKQAKADYSKRRRQEELERQRLEADAMERMRAKSSERREKEKESLRKEKEKQKLAVKSQRKELRHHLQNNFKYFENIVGCENVYEVKQQIDILCQMLSQQALVDLNSKFIDQSDESIAYDEFVKSLSSIHEDNVSGHSKKMSNISSDGNSNDIDSRKSKWNIHARNTLVKAFKLFPPGTEKRWDVIAAYLNQHVERDDKNSVFTSRDTLKYAKSLSNDDSYAKAENNAKAYDTFSATVKNSQIIDSAKLTTGMEAQRHRPWTSLEQKALEAALRTVKAKSGADRWQEIADAVGTRTRRECMLRYKQLAEEVKAKKAAIDASKLK